MSQDAQAILSAAVGLSEEDRIRVIEVLLSTIGSDNDADTAAIEAAWTEVAERRADELDRGLVKPVPWSEVRAAGEALFHGKR